RRLLGLAGGRALRDLERRGDPRRLRGADAARGVKVLEIALPQLSHAFREKLARELDRVLAAQAGAEEDRDQFGVRERFGAVFEHPLARTVVAGQLADHFIHQRTSRMAWTRGGVAAAAFAAIANVQAELSALASGLISIESPWCSRTKPAAGWTTPDVPTMTRRSALRIALTARATASSGSVSPNQTTSGRRSAPQSQRGGIVGNGSSRVSTCWS